MERKASVCWNGGLKDGSGKISAQSGAFSNLEYAFGTRFEQQAGTNPEELLAAGHAACFTMALSAELGKIGLKPVELRTDATIFVDTTGAGWDISRIELSTSGEVPGVTSEQFVEAATQAKNNCPVSRLFKANITLRARLSR